MSIIFGPVNSRRFGLSLGVDLSPYKKQCNFDCLYCELTRAKPITNQENPLLVDEIIKEVKKGLLKHPNIDVITLTANGEPTLYPYLDELIDRLNKIKKNKKLLILSNASTITNPTIQKALQKLDIVKLSLDCATQKCFKKLDRPTKEIEIKKIIEGVEEFRKNYKGFLVIEILVVKGVNDRANEFQALAKILEKIKPNRVDIGTIDRPPAYNVKPILPQTLYQLASFLPKLPVSIITKTNTNLAQSFNQNELLEMIKRRPLSQEDIKTLLDKDSQKRFWKLFKEGKIKRRELGSLLFYETT